MTRKLTLVAVGDASSDKTQLLIEYTSTSPYREYLPQTFVNNVKDLIVDSVPYSVYFIDAEADDDFKTFRKEYYRQASCILLCYSMNDRNSFENLKSKWIMEIRRTVMKTPMIIVATGAESRSNPRQRAEVTSEEGVNLRYLVGAMLYVECSVKTCSGIDNVFIEAVRSTYEDRTWHRRLQR